MSNDAHELVEGRLDLIMPDEPRIDDIVAGNAMLAGARLLLLSADRALLASISTVVSPVCRVSSVATSEEALARIGRLPVDILVADSDLPGGGAWALLDAVRGKPDHPDLPVIVIGSGLDSESRVELLLHGADDCIGKPVSPRELLARAGALLRLRGLAADCQRRADYAVLTRVHEASSRLISADALPTLLEAVVDAAVAISSADKGSLQLYDAETGSLQVVAQRGFDDPSVERKSALLDVAGPFGKVIELRQRVVVRDVRRSALFGEPSLKALMNEVGIRAVQVTPLIGLDGHLLGIVSTHWNKPHRPDEHCLQALDLLARHAADLIEHRRREGALLQASQRKDEFLAMLGHELRNPLTPIVLILDSLRRRSKDPFQSEHTAIRQQVQHMLRLVDDLLDITRIARGSLTLQRRRIVLKDVATLAVQMAAPLIQKRRHHLNVDIRRIELDADPERLAQVIANLLTNAARYTPAGGHITLRARRTRGWVIMVVEDDGIGIAPEFLDQVFDTATKATPPDGVKGGLGLGLAIVRHLVGLHGGSVAAESEGRGKGSRFIVRLPVGVPGTESEVSEAAGTGQALKSRRILVVDDNEELLEWLPSLLRRLGNVVLTARDGPEALNLLNTYRPNVAIVDIGLPMMSGHELAVRIREKLGNDAPALIALTGYGQDADRERSRKAGFQSHVVKPRLDGLLEAIEACTPKAGSKASGETAAAGR